MKEISLPLIDKWRCRISLSGSGKEDFFKHDRASISMETRSWQQLAAENYVDWRPSPPSTPN